MVYRKLGFPAKVVTKEDDVDTCSFSTITRSSQVTVEVDSVSVEYTFDLDAKLSIEPSLERVIKSFFLSVVYVCIDQLHVLKKEYLAFAEQTEVKKITYKSIHERFGDVEANYQDIRINSPYTEMHKLLKDVTTTIFLLDTLVSEMEDYGSFATAMEYMDTISKMRQDEENLMNELKVKRDLYDYVKRAQIKERQMSVNVINTYNNSIKETLRVYQNVSESARIEVRYVQDWENARFEQNRLKLEETENNLFNESLDMRDHIELEEGCHEEMELYIMESYEEYMDEIQKWMDLYEATLENKEGQISNLEIEIEKLHDQYEALKREYDDRSVEMEEWLAYKAKKEENEKYLAMQIWAATKIQAWWRGIMVRRKLYKKHKKGKKRGGKKGKK